MVSSALGALTVKKVSACIYRPDVLENLFATTTIKLFDCLWMIRLNVLVKITPSGSRVRCRPTERTITAPCPHQQDRINECSGKDGVASVSMLRTFNDKHQKKSVQNSLFASFEDLKRQIPKGFDAKPTFYTCG